MSSLALVGAIIAFMGTLVCLVGAIGLIRLPDFFARTHAGGVTDTMGAGLTILGMVLLAIAFDGPLEYRALVIIKLISIAVLMLVTSPIAGHAVARAALESGVGMDTVPLELLRRTRFAKDIPNIQFTGTPTEQLAQCEACLDSLHKFGRLTSREQQFIQYLCPPFTPEQVVEYNNNHTKIIADRSSFATREFLPEGLNAQAAILKHLIVEKHQQLSGEVSA